MHQMIRKFHQIPKQTLESAALDEPFKVAELCAGGTSAQCLNVRSKADVRTSYVNSE